MGPRRPSLAACAVSAAIAFALFAGCGAARPYRTITLTFDNQAPATLGADPDELRVAQVVARLIRDRFGLPFPEGTTVHVYVNQATFAEGLAREGGHVSAEAWDHARVATAVASPRGLFLRGDIVNAMRLIDRVGLVAHELAHVCQMEMRRGGRGAPAQWIREGHADWVKYQVIDVLAMRTYAESRDEVTRAILRGTTPIRFFPPLNDIARRDGGRMRRSGSDGRRRMARHSSPSTGSSTAMVSIGSIRSAVAFQRMMPTRARTGRACTPSPIRNS